MDRKDTLKILSVLRGAYPGFYRSISKAEAEDTVALWQAMFADYDYKTVESATYALIASDTKGFPPNIGQVIEKILLLTQPQEMTEAEAWAIVYKAIQNSAYDSRKEFDKLPPGIQSVVHDPAQLKAWAIDPQFNPGVESSNFKRAYRVRAAQLREFAALPESVRQYALSMGGGCLRLDEGRKSG